MLTKALPTTLITAHLLRVGTALTLSAILFALAGCSSINEMMAEGSKPPAIVNVATDQQPFYDALNSLILPPKSPQAAPQGIADGPYNGVMPEGEQFTTFVKNGYFDEFLVVYYPNFVTQLRTDLVNGLYDGWVTYRLSDSRIKQKVLFRQGVVQEAIVYSQAGNPEYHFWFTNEQPTSGMRYDSNGNAVESMF
ncbi:hypothetical protein FEF33_08090 [Moraxella osloensis]|jgi:hypothetical protein|nr:MULTISPECIES: hypothetical protein [Moraxella]ATQ84603.1 hypothetical protein KSH_01550 [Moraxella osloensis]MBW4016190.1 hypothetical protein [Moraxella osloensis]QCR85866.1 hypothetical protein FEF33_08090 [Moraxella osloensis]HCN15040.1 hypothetical protein [Moraxellaceae bacterium]